MHFFLLTIIPYGITMSKITARRSRGIFYQNNRKNRYAIRHIGKETKYINLWDYINLRNSSAEGNAR